MKIILAFLILSLTLGTVSAQFTKLLDFAGATSGERPKGSLISDGTFLYGAAFGGGLNNMGTLFKIMPDGTGYVKLLDFSGTTTGSFPTCTLISDGTFLYGTTVLGGANNMGTIFKIMPDGTGFTKLFEFEGVTNGREPYTSLSYDGTNLYGMTFKGGKNNMGVLFKIMPNGTGFVKLVDFDGDNLGRNPDMGSLISDGTFLYGMTSYGGVHDMGTIFKIMPDGTGFLKLVDFDGANNGSTPDNSLFSDGIFFYGMTSFGGSNGKGTLFKIMPDGSGFTKLIDFAGSTNGSNPIGSIISDGTFLYGTTFTGGSYNEGTLFQIKPNGTGYIKLYDFNKSNGSNPRGSIISDRTFLYGMTDFGGNHGIGTLFKYQFSAFSSITDNNKAFALFVFPNPVKDILTVRSPSGVSFEKVIITDFTGKEVLAQTRNLTQIDVSLLTPGMYLLRITSEGKKSVSKFIKQ